MEKNYAKFRNLALILIIILITLIAFVGVYTRKFNIYKDFIPEYKTGMDFDGYVELKFKLSNNSEEKEVWVDPDGNFKGYVPEKEEETTSEEQGPEEVSKEEKQEDISIFKKETKTIKDNEDSVLNKESYNRTKKLIEKRLRSVGVSEYNIHLDNSTGNLTIDMPETSEVSSLYQLITGKGELTVVDSENGVILISGDHVKKASSVYGQARTGEGYQVYLQIEYDKEGTKLLKEVSSNYIESTDSEGNKTQKTIDVQIDGQTITKTYFSTENGPIGTGQIQIPIGTASADQSVFRDYLASTSKTATVIDSGRLDNVYTLTSDVFVKSRISDNFILIAKIATCILLVVITIVLTIVFKGKGFLAGISNIGFISLLSIMIRYTNVTIAFNSLIILSMLELLNIIFIVMLLKGINNSKEGSKYAITQVMKQYYMAIIPIIVFALILTFETTITVGTIGMVTFWGLFVQLVYNIVITRTMYI